MKQPHYDLGILGGGQLARMSIMAAQRMGLTCLSLDHGKVTPASLVAPALVGGFDEHDQMVELFKSCRHVTLENEFVPAATIENAIEAARVDPRVLLPGTAALATIQDKLLQRAALARAGVPGPKAVPAWEAADLGLPVVLKARFGGYDGKGTRYARTRADLDAHLAEIETGSWLAEEFVPFTRELAVMVCRSQNQTVCFPTMETVQVNHVCDTVFPAGADASEIAIAAVEAIEGYGLFGVELFEGADGTRLVNEIAPRPHNTGHYSLDWGGISQFEAHVRLVLGIPVPTPTGQDAAMANILGKDPSGPHTKAAAAALAQVPTAHFHWYGKDDARPGRKMGHINAVGPECLQAVVAARLAFYEAW